MSCLECFGGIWAFEGNLIDLNEFCTGNQIDLDLENSGYLFYYFSEEDISKEIEDNSTNINWQPLGYITAESDFVWTVPEYDTNSQFVNFKYVSSKWARYNTLYDLDIPVNCDAIIGGDGSNSKTDNSFFQDFSTQIGPNPFVDVVNINFDLPKQSEVSISIYDLNGRLIDVLAENEIMGLGTQNIRYNASHLRSGVYFVNLTAGTYQKDFKILKIE